jgi:hypothetical protein
MAQKVVAIGVGAGLAYAAAQYFATPAVQSSETSIGSGAKVAKPVKAKVKKSQSVV